MEGLKKLKRFYKRYERFLIPGALLFGFLTDVLTFRLINFPLAMGFLGGHLVFIGINISIINFYEADKIRGKFFSYWRILAPLFLQYSFGNLFSGFLIFYSHSGSFSASWPFFVVIIILMIGNEIFRKYNIKPSIQISVYFFALFSYFNLLFPNILRNLSSLIFIGSGVVSFLFILSFLFFLSSSLPHLEREKKKIIFITGGIFFAMNFFYFFNIIPPIPLSVQDVGVFHQITRTNGDYLVVTEKCTSWERCLFFPEKRHIKNERENIYLFSAVFAPEEMELKVLHQWEKFNYEKKMWEIKAEVPFSVSGGRDQGYRWYTYYSVSPGYWRVNIKTQKGQVIGRKDFYVFKGLFPRVKEKI